MRALDVATKLGPSRRRTAACGVDGGHDNLDRLDGRRSLLEQLEAARPGLDAAVERAGLDRQRAMAYSLLSSDRLRRAFDLDEERPATREQYGMTLFGQATLTARRLVEAGGRFVTVFWDEFGLAGTGWDTHWDHYPRMKDELLPGLDQTLSGLLLDCAAWGVTDPGRLAFLDPPPAPALTEARTMSVPAPASSLTMSPASSTR